MPLHKIRHGIMPPLIKYVPGGFTSLSQVVLAEKPDNSMPAHMEGLEGNLPIETLI
jgi:hypothetical protein